MKSGDYQIFSESGDVVVLSEADAKRELTGKSDFELHLEVTRAKLSPNERAIVQAAALSQLELDRRASELNEKIAKRTTYWSATVAVVSVIIGAVLGAVLS